MDQEEELVDINTNRGDNVDIRYYYIPLKILPVMVIKGLRPL